MSARGSKNLSFARRSQKAAIAAVSLAEPAEFSADIAVRRVVCVADRGRQAVALLSQVRFPPVVPRGSACFLSRSRLFATGSLANRSHDPQIDDRRNPGTGAILEGRQPVQPWTPTFEFQKCRPILGRTLKKRGQLAPHSIHIPLNHLS